MTYKNCGKSSSSRTSLNKNCWSSNTVRILVAILQSSCGKEQDVQHSSDIYSKSASRTALTVDVDICAHTHKSSVFQWIIIEVMCIIFTLVLKAAMLTLTR